MSERNISKIIFMFVIIYKKSQSKNFINTYCTKHRKIIRRNKKWHNIENDVNCYFHTSL